MRVLLAAVRGTFWVLTAGVWAVWKVGIVLPMKIMVGTFQALS